MSDPCRPCTEVRCVVEPDTTLYSIAGLPNQPPPPQPPSPTPQVGNDAVYYATSCGAGARLVLTGTPPSWITIGTFANRVYGAANAFFRDTKTAANITAQAELDSWVASVLASGALRCNYIPTENLWGWWKADAITGYNDGDQLADWVDSSGNNYDLTAAPAMPVYKTGILNALPAVNFGSIVPSSYFVMPAFMTGFTEAEFFIVIKADLENNPNPNSSGVFSLGSFAGSDAYIHFGTTGPYLSFASTQRYNLASPTTVHIANWIILHMVSKAGDWRAYIDGTLIYSDATNVVGFAPASPFVGALVGRSALLFSEFFYGYIAEMIYYSQENSTDNRTTIMDYLHTKYGI